MNIRHTPYFVTPLGNRYFRFQFCTIRVNQHFYIVREGFVSNFRSGPQCDRILDQIGDDLTQTAYLVHDLNYNKDMDGNHAMSRKEADNLLYDMLVYAGMGKFKARLVWLSVRLFGGSAYKSSDDYTANNCTKFTYIRH